MATTATLECGGRASAFASLPPSQCFGGPPSVSGGWPRTAVARRRLSALLLAVAVCLSAAPVSAQPPRAWQLLEGGLKDQKEEVRTAAAHALGLAAGNQRARQLAEWVLSDEQEGVRAAGAEALGQIGLPAAAPALKKALRRPIRRGRVLGGQRAVRVEGPRGVRGLLRGAHRRTQVWRGAGPVAARPAEGPAGAGEDRLRDGHRVHPVWRDRLQGRQGRSPPTRRRRCARRRRRSSSATATRKTTQALVNALKDDKWMVRAAAVQRARQARRPQAASPPSRRCSTTSTSRSASTRQRR